MIYCLSFIELSYNYEYCLSFIELSYNYSVHSITDYSSFKIIYYFNLLTPLNLIPFIF